MPRATIRDVAKFAKLSVSTVNRALHEPDKVREDTNRDFFMAPENAKDYGIIDAVYSEQWDSLTAQHHDEKAAEAAVEAGDAEVAPQPKRSKSDPAG